MSHEEMNRFFGDVVETFLCAESYWFLNEVSSRCAGRSMGQAGNRGILSSRDVTRDDFCGALFATRSVIRLLITRRVGS